MMDILDFSDEENNNGNGNGNRQNNNQKQNQCEKRFASEGWNSPSPPRHSHINENSKNNDKKLRPNESPKKRTSSHSECGNKNYENSLYTNNKRATKNYQNSNKVLIRSQSSHCVRNSSDQISSTFKRDLGADYRNQIPPNFNKYYSSSSSSNSNNNNNKFRSTARFNNGYSMSKNFMKPDNTILPKFKWNTNINSNTRYSSFNPDYYNYKYRLNSHSVKIGSFQSENSNSIKNYIDKSTKQKRIHTEQEQQINTINTNNDHKEQIKEAEKENNSSIDFYFQIKIVNSYREFCQIKTKNIFCFSSAIETISFLKSLSKNSNPAINTTSQPVILFLDGAEQIFYGAGVVCLKEFSQMNNNIDTNLIESMNFRINWIYLSEVEVSEIYNLQKNDLQDSKVRILFISFCTLSLKMFIFTFY